MIGGKSSANRHPSKIMITRDVRISLLIRLLSFTSMRFPIENLGRCLVIFLMRNSKIIDKIIPNKVGKVAIVEPDANNNNVKIKLPIFGLDVHSKPIELKLVGSTLAKRLGGIENAVQKQSIIIRMMIKVLVLI